MYVSICIYKACERCLSMALGVMKVIGIDFVVILIFYSMFLLLLEFIEYL